MGSFSPRALSLPARFAAGLVVAVGFGFLLAEAVGGFAGVSAALVHKDRRSATVPGAPSAALSRTPQESLPQRHPAAGDVEAGAVVVPVASGETFTMVAGQTLSGAILDHYGRFEPEMLEAFAQVNPWLVDLDMIDAGTVIRVPVSVSSEDRSVP